MDRLNHLLLTFLLITVLCLAVKSSYTKEQVRKGEAISNFLDHYHALEVAPEEARFFDVTITTYDVTISGMDVYMTEIKGNK